MGEGYKGQIETRHIKKRIGKLHMTKHKNVQKELHFIYEGKHPLFCETEVRRALPEGKPLVDA
jgi:hypothetical protein